MTSFTHNYDDVSCLKNFLFKNPSRCTEKCTRDRAFFYFTAPCTLDKFAGNGYRGCYEWELPIACLTSAEEIMRSSKLLCVIVHRMSESAGDGRLDIGEFDPAHDDGAVARLFSLLPLATRTNSERISRYTMRTGNINDL